MLQNTNKINSQTTCEGRPRGIMQLHVTHFKNKRLLTKEEHFFFLFAAAVTRKPPVRTPKEARWLKSKTDPPQPLQNLRQAMLQGQKD